MRAIDAELQNEPGRRVAGRRAVALRGLLAVAALGAVLAGCGSSSTAGAPAITAGTSTAAATTGPAAIPLTSTTTPATTTRAAATTPRAAATTPRAAATTTRAAATTTHATPTPAPPQTPVVHLPVFKTPTTNIGCTIVTGSARCDIHRRSWSPPRRPSTCSKRFDFGQGLIVTSSGTVGLVCAGDSALDPSDRKLPYGTDTVVDGFRCQSRFAGVTCTNSATSHGFFISIQNYRTF